MYMVINIGYKQIKSIKEYLNIALILLLHFKYLKDTTGQEQSSAVS